MFWFKFEIQSMKNSISCLKIVLLAVYIYKHFLAVLFYRSQRPESRMDIKGKNTKKEKRIRRKRFTQIPTVILGTLHTVESLNLNLPGTATGNNTENI